MWEFLKKIINMAKQSYSFICWMSCRQHRSGSFLHVPPQAVRRSDKWSGRRRGHYHCVMWTLVCVLSAGWYKMQCLLLRRGLKRFPCVCAEAQRKHLDVARRSWSCCSPSVITSISLWQNKKRVEKSLLAWNPEFRLLNKILTIEAYLTHWHTTFYNTWRTYKY